MAAHESYDHESRAEAAPPAVARRRFEEKDEIVVAVILSLATLLTSWAGYQAAVWGGVQAEAYARGDELRTASSRASIQQGQLQSIDAFLLSQWLNAYTSGDTRLASAYRARFRTEMKPAFNAWLATNPLANPAAPSSPFAMPDYRRQMQRQADALGQQANASFAAGDRAHRTVDTYVRATVALSSAMFFGGIGQAFRLRRVRIALMVLSAATCLLGALQIVGLPVDRVGL